MGVKEAKKVINSRLAALKVKMQEKIEKGGSKRVVYKELLNLMDDACDEFDEIGQDGEEEDLLLDALEQFVQDVGDLVDAPRKLQDVNAELLTLPWTI